MYSLSDAKDIVVQFGSSYIRSSDPSIFFAILKSDLQCYTENYQPEPLIVLSEMLMLMDDVLVHLADKNTHESQYDLSISAFENYCMNFICTFRLRETASNRVLFRKLCCLLYGHKSMHKRKKYRKLMGRLQNNANRILDALLEKIQ